MYNSRNALLINSMHIKKLSLAIMMMLTCLISTTSLLLASNQAVGATTTPVVTTPIKWHPGHYYTIMDYAKNASWYLSQVYREIKSTPALRGLQIRYSWAELETSEGVYNFSSIARRLNELAEIDKRLVIVVETKTFDPEEILIPNYLKTQIYEGGQYLFSTPNKAGVEGYNLKLWNPEVRDRFKALIRALGKRFNSESNFEGIGLTETALGQPDIPLTTQQIDDYFSNLLDIQQQMRTAFPNTMTFQFTNYPRPILQSFIGGLQAMGAGLGGPDVFLEDRGLNYPHEPRGVYNYYPENSGIIPLAPSVMHSNYKNTKADGTGFEPTIMELLNFARDTLKANYIFWHRDPDYYRRVLETLNQKNQKINPAGGLNTACPVVYASCVN